MPPSAVKTIRDLIFWQYAKIISTSSGIGKKNYGFIMTKFKELQTGEISWNEIREYVKERKINVCIFCGSETELTVEHLFPRVLNGPDNEKNIIWICKKCNSSKGSKKLYEWWTTRIGLKNAKYNVPRIAEGKYLKLIYESLKRSDMLEFDIEKIKNKVCPECDLKTLCKKENSENTLSILCLDRIATIRFKEGYTD